MEHVLRVLQEPLVQRERAQRVRLVTWEACPIWRPVNVILVPLGLMETKIHIGGQNVSSVLLELRAQWLAIRRVPLSAFSAPRAPTAARELRSALHVRPEPTATREREDVWWEGQVRSLPVLSRSF